MNRFKRAYARDVLVSQKHVLCGHAKRFCPLHNKSQRPHMAKETTCTMQRTCKRPLPALPSSYLPALPSTHERLNDAICLLCLQAKFLGEKVDALLCSRGSLRRVPSVVISNVSPAKRLLMRLPKCPASSAQTTGTATHLVLVLLLSMRTFIVGADTIGPSSSPVATHAISKCMPHPPLESVRVAQTSAPLVVMSNASPA